jgi:sugar lactone lactonase YvrE
VVARDLGVPDSVKFDSTGQIISTQTGSGQVLRIDPRTGAKTVLADLDPGLDNCTFVGDRLFVSHGAGAVIEILGPGRTRGLVDRGLLWPMGLAVGDDGTVFVADGPYAYALHSGRALDVLGSLYATGYPGFTRGVAAAGNGEWIVTTAFGEVKRYSPARHESETIAAGYDRLMDVALTRDGAVIFAESATGRVLCAAGGNVETLATELAKPVGVALTSNGDCYVSEAEGGRIAKVGGGRLETVIDGLETPEGIAIHHDRLFILDVGAKCVVECGLSGENRRVVATDLPVGAPAGVVPKYLGGCGDLAGPMVNFAGIAAGPDGTLFIAADGEGSVLALRPE